ncbi:MAG: septum formation inhibitor Maf [Saprospiraceae bacterium]|nr:septum formation inhibitor Maf [Saprospiraceae bacterium]
MRVLFFLASLSLFWACESPSTEQEAGVPATLVSQPNDKSTEQAGLGQQWYQGKAEITSYTLMQNRYQDVHPGQAVMVFVTEDFLTDKQVKNDNYTNPNSIPILKMNRVLSFPTGLYDYHIMTSTFTPVQTKQHPHTLKVTQSTTEWCGQVFSQLNYDQGYYRSQLFSYFESEGDQETKVKAGLLEDEVFNRIRMEPEALPTGKLKMLPSSTYLRLAHRPTQLVEAENTMSSYTGEDFEGAALMVYTVNYPVHNRTLEIVFEKASPHAIVGWKDTYPSAFDRQARTSIATRKKSLWTPYWSQNSLNDMALRAELDLD